jgi:hypothetical protein
MSAVTAKRRLPIPALVGTAFGGLWSVLGAMALPQHWTVPVVVIGLLVTVFLLLQRCRNAGSGSRLFRRRAYIVAVVLEVAGLYVAMLLLQKYGLEPFFVQALGFVVGLHFIGLWVASGQCRYLWLCFSMCVVSLIGIMLPSAASGHFNLRNVVTAYGCAVALWFIARPTARGLVNGQA